MERYGEMVEEETPKKDDLYLNFQEFSKARAKGNRPNSRQENQRNMTVNITRDDDSESFDTSSNYSKRTKHNSTIHTTINENDSDELKRLKKKLKETEEQIILGSFDKSFLALPEEVIITSMKKNQRYFALRDANGRLSNSFVLVSNSTLPYSKYIVLGNFP